MTGDQCPEQTQVDRLCSPTIFRANIIQPACLTTKLGLTASAAILYKYYKLSKLATFGNLEVFTLFAGLVKQIETHFLIRYEI